MPLEAVRQAVGHQKCTILADTKTLASQPCSELTAIRSSTTYSSGRQRTDSSTAL